MSLLVARYLPVVRNPAVRRLLPGFAVSALGDGMSVVAVAWLALALAPPGHEVGWVAVCSAAAVLPGVLFGLAGGRMLAGVAPARLGLLDSWLRALALGAVPLTSLAGVLDVELLAVLLGIASLLRAWGSAGQYALLALALPPSGRLAGNALLGTLADAGTLLGPVLAALLITAAGPVAVIAADAASFAVLAVAYRAADRALAAPPAPPGPSNPEDARASLRSVVRVPAVAVLLATTFAFFALYGPVEVALPVLVARDLHAPAGLFATYVTVFGLGAVLGGLAAGRLGSLPLVPLVVAIVVGWGVCLLPLGSGAPQPVALASFGVGAFVYAPYLAVTTEVVQRVCPPALLSRVLALRAAVLGSAVPVGALVGGPLVAAAGPRTAILTSALATIALGAVVAIVLRGHDATRSLRPRRL